MRWRIPIYNPWGQHIKNLMIRCTNEVRTQTRAEHIAEDYVEAKHPDCHIDYSEIEEVIDEIEVQEVNL